MSKLIDAAFAARRECREAFEPYLQAQYERAEAATNGAMLNKRGRQAGIDPWRLFTSNATYRRAYASEELLEHWERHPHITYAQFERDWAKAIEGTNLEHHGEEPF